MWQVFEVLPAGTVTEAGTETSPWLLESATTEPPTGARPVSLTVPVAVRPEMPVAGVTERLESAVGATVTVTILETPSVRAVTVTLVDTEGATVVTGKVAEV